MLLPIGTTTDGLGTNGLSLLLILVAMVPGILAQARVRSTFGRYSQVRSRSGYTGTMAARRILDAQGLHDIPIERIPGQLTDHFDPRTRILRLSESTAEIPSVAAVGVAAHEAGHAMQHAAGYAPNRLRGFLVPIANIGSNAGPYLAIFGILLGFGFLVNIGIALYAFAVLFFIVTLPVEYNASHRAMCALEDTGILSEEELAGARKVLNAAALTYLASALAAVATLARLLLISRSGRRRS